MARHEVPVFTINRISFTPDVQVAGNPTDGMFFSENAGYTFLEVENSGTQPWIVGAVVNDNKVDAISIPNKEMSIDGGSTAFFGPFPTQWYNQDNLDVYFDAESAELLFRAYAVI